MKIVMLFLLSVMELCASAQYSRVIVQFTNKNSTPFSLGAPQQYLSARALARRSRYAISLDSTDLPIVPRYIDSVKAQGAVTVLSQSRWLNQLLIQTGDSAALQKIKALPFVRTSQRVGLRREQTAGTPADKPEPVLSSPLPGNQRVAADVYDYGSAYNQIHIHQGEYLHNKGYSGQGMIITVLDAGFSNYRTITAFDSIRLRGQVLGERDFVAFDNSVNEDDSHGRSCLSIIAANWPGSMVGSAPGASFWLVRTEDAASEYPVEEHNWAVGAEFADSCGTDIITSSLGYTTFSDASFNHSYSQFYNNSTVVTMAASLAARKGIIVTNSAGNDGTSAWKYLGFPADADSVCSVGAVNISNTIATFSSYGYPGKQKPNVVSVGSGTVIAGTTAPTMGNGTSFSNPNIAGLITCLWQAFPRFNNMKILNALYASSDKAAIPDNRYGYGLPNMKTAYGILKTDENKLLYGNTLLWADPVIFSDTLSVHFISQADGSNRIELLNSGGQVVATKSFIAEKQELYSTVFLNLAIQPDGLYTVRYSDSLQTKIIQVQKGAVTSSKLTLYPNPARGSVQVLLTSGVAQTANLRLFNQLGQVVKEQPADLSRGSNLIVFRLHGLAAGAYTMRVQLGTQKLTARLAVR